MRSVRTRQALVEAMFGLLNDKEFDAITIQEICRAASISRTAFYLHFEDKYSLTLCCIEQVIKKIPAEKGGDTIESIILALLDAVFDRRKALQNLLKLEGSRELQIKMDQMFVNLYHNYYLERQKEGTLFPAPLEVTAIYNSAGVTKVMEWWIKRDCIDAKETILKYIMLLHEAQLEP